MFFPPSGVQNIPSDQRYDIHMKRYSYKAIFVYSDILINDIHIKRYSYEAIFVKSDIRIKRYSLKRDIRIKRYSNKVVLETNQMN